MPINIWEQAGKPTSYNPMQTGWGNNISTALIMGMDLVVRFRAKSPTRAVLQVTDTGGANISKVFPLNTEFTQYEFTWLQKANTNVFCFYDNASVGDIVMENIELIQKPLGKATINGLDGFKSGKWTFANGTRAIDDETLEMTIENGYQRTMIDIPVLPSQDYSISVEKVGISEPSFVIRAMNASGTVLVNPVVDYLPGLRTFTFKTWPDCTKIRIEFGSNASITIGEKMLFKRPMLNLGTIPAPYEKKRGERLVLPKSGNNLMIDQTAFNWTTDPLVTKTLQPDGSILLESTTKQNGIWITPARLGLDLNGSYSFSCSVRADTPQRATIEKSGLYYFDVGTEWERISVNGGPTSSFAFKPGDSLVPGKVYFKDFQIEENPFATDFNPVKVQRNKRAIGQIPKKNLIRGEKEQDSGLFNAGTGTGPLNEWVTDSSGRAKLKVQAGSSNHHGKGLAIPVEIGKTYTFSCLSEGTGTGAQSGVPRIIIGSTDKGTEYISALFPVSTPEGFTFTATTNTVWVRLLINGQSTLDPVYFWNIQLEEGTNKTSFNSFGLRPKKRANGIPKKNIYDGVYVPGYITTGNLAEAVTAGSSGQRTTPWIICKPNTAYTLSGHDRTSWHFKNAAGAITSALGATITTPADAVLMRVYYSSDGTHQEVQIEEGSIATAYEPFKFINKPARKGLEFNKDGFITVPYKFKEVGAIEVKFKHGSLYDFNSIFDTPLGADVWELWTYANGLLRGRMTTGVTLTSSVYLKAGIDYALRWEWDNTGNRMYLDGVLVGTSPTVWLEPADSFYINGGHTYNSKGHNTFYSFKVWEYGKLAVEYDFTNPLTVTGAKVKGKGPAATISGTPLQLNKQARR
jgi:hypothetical protein